MIKKEEIYAKKAEIAEVRHADGVYRDIKARISERPEYNQRWFWELLQNAKDSVDENQNVDIKIELDQQHLIFAHSGNDFDIEEILSLILQGSSKNEKVGKAGRFGTGFMTTYLLSRKVEITGRMSNENGAFQFILNREGATNSEFFQNQTGSNEAFANSVRETPYIDNGEHQTKFKYFLDLDPKNSDTAEIGVKSMKELIPFTQVFNDQIASVIFKNGGSETEYKKKKLDDVVLNGDKIAVTELTRIKDGKTEHEVKSYVIRGEDFDVCLMTEIVMGHETIVSMDEKYPKLYFTFPLIGTEDLGIPLIINSLKFEPKVERDGIYLADKESQQVKSNQQLISTALKKAITTFIKLVVDKSIVGIDELFSIRPSAVYPWLDLQWLNSLKIEIFDSLKDIKCIPVNSADNKLASLEELSVPYENGESSSLDLWSVASYIESVSLPEQKKLTKWKDICDFQASLRIIEVKDFYLSFGLENLLKFIEETKTSTNLASSLTGIMVYAWVNKAYKLINGLSDIFPLDREIMLNQKNTFRKSEGMQWDITKDQQLNAISEKIGLNFESFLANNSLSQFEITGMREFDKKYAVSSILNKFTTLEEKEYAAQTIQHANAEFLKWLIDNKADDTIKELKILCSDKKSDSDTIVVQQFLKGKHLILAPKISFEQEFPIYATIIRNKDCLHNIYNGFLSKDDYEYLDRKGFIHLSPIVIRTESLDTKLMEQLIVDTTQIALLVEEDGKLKYDIEITYSDFAYLTSTEGHIYDRNSTPSSSLERFRFLLLEACEKDEKMMNPPFEFLIPNDLNSIKFNNCLWLCRARDLPWIKIKNSEAGSDQKFSEAPSSKNLSNLIIGKDEMIKAIKGDKQQHLLNHLGVGVSDLIRSTLSTEELKLSWDKAITSMIISDADPALIQEIFNDAGIKQEYQRRLNQRKLIARNQNLGGLIEILFKQAVKDLKDNGAIIDIRREPFGSDYIITDESSDLVNDQMIREGFKINDWLLEVKATGKDFAAMTTLQAQTASDFSSQYALVVVPIDGSEITLDYVKDNAKIIDNIGEHIDEVIHDYEDLEAKKEVLLEGTDSVSVNIEDHKVRFRVKSNLWEDPTAKSINDFILNKFKS